MTAALSKLSACGQEHEDHFQKLKECVDAVGQSGFCSFFCPPELFFFTM